MKIGYIGVGEKPRIVEVEPDGHGSYLKAFQGLVGGYIEYFEPLYGTSPSLIVNENGIAECMPNRAVFATREMEDAGYIDMVTYTHPVKEGELYTVLFGPILAVPLSWDDEGNEVHRDIADGEFARLCEDFRDAGSGLRAVVGMLLETA